MADLQLNGNITDYYKMNEDYTGTRSLDSQHEIVEYLNSSTVRIWYNEQNENYEEHWHNAMEIIMPVENSYQAEVCGKRYTFQPGEMFIIPPGEVHKLFAPPSGKRFIFLFDISILTKIKGFSGIQSILSEPIHVNKENYPYIHEDIYQYLVQIRNEYFYGNEYAELAIHSLLLQLFMKFGYNHISTVNLFPNVRIHKQKEYVQKFNDLMEFIDEHYMEEINLEVIAEQSGFSKYHFSRLFKQYTNFTFCDYLTYRRIKAAEALLVEPDLSITEIALQAGFPSISTFNRIFKQEKHCTPSEYRAKNHQLHLQVKPNIDK